MPLQIQLQNRQRDPTIRSSLHNSITRKKTLRKDSIFFFNDFIKDKEEDSTPLTSPNNLFVEQHNFKTQKEDITIQDQMFLLFKNNQLSKEFVQNIQQNKFKPTVIISLLLPFNLIKKVVHILIGFQYMHSNINKLLCRRTFHYQELEDVNLMFWILQLQSEEPNIRKSSKFKKQQWRQKTAQTSFLNSLRMIIQLPHIVITTKKFIQQNLNRFMKISQVSFKEQIQKKIRDVIDIQQHLIYCQQNEQTNPPQQSAIGLKQILQSNACFKHIQQINLKTLTSQKLVLQSEQFISESNDNYSRINTAKNQSSFKKNKSSLSQVCNQFKWIFHQCMLITLKQNWEYTNCTSTWFSLHLYSNMYKNLQKQTYNSILQKSLKNFKKQFQTKYLYELDRVTEAMDQFKLRNILQNIRKDLVIQLKKNIKNIMTPKTKSMQTINANGSNIRLQKSNNNCNFTTINRDYIHNVQYQIMEFINKEQKNAYNQNNKKAIQWNQKILQSSYETVIQNIQRQIASKKTDILGSSSASIRINQANQSAIRNNLQKDFQNFMEQYLAKGIKVSSQLKTFNSFMQKNKPIYLNKINRIFSQKRFRNNQVQQRQEKQQILKTLQLEVQLLEDKKKQVQQHNKSVKKIIKSHLQQHQKTKIIKQKQLMKKKSLNESIVKKNSKQISSNGSIKGSLKEEVQSSGRPMHRSRFGHKKQQQAKEEQEQTKQNKGKCCCQIM